MASSASSRAACSTIAGALGPVKSAVPAATPSGRSVVSRITRIGPPSEGTSSWTPPDGFHKPGGVRSQTLVGAYHVELGVDGKPKVSTTWRNIFLCWPVATTLQRNSSAPRSAATTGAILTASGLPPLALLAVLCCGGRPSRRATIRRRAK